MVWTQRVPNATLGQGRVPNRPVVVPSVRARRRRPPFWLAPTRSSLKPSEIPSPPPLLVDREREILELANYLTQPQATPPVGVISGAAGVGKSAFAIAAAHSIADRFRQGQLYIQMPWSQQSTQDLRSALTRVAETMKVPVTRFIDPDATGTRAFPNQPRFLVLLDGINDTFDDGALLALGLRSCAVMLTSREPLAGIGNCFSLELQPLTEDAAFTLLAELIGQARMDEDPAFVQRLLAAAQGIPFLIHLAAASLNLRPGWEMKVFSSRIDDNSDVGRDEQSYAKRIFDLSFTLLTESQKNIMLQLGSLGPGVFTARQVYSAIGVADDRTVTQSLHALARARLIQRVADERTARASYRIARLTAGYIKDRLAQERQDVRKNIITPKSTISSTQGRSPVLLPAVEIRELYYQGMLGEALQAARNATTALREAGETTSERIPPESCDSRGQYSVGPSLSPESAASDRGLSLGSATAIQAELHMELCLDDSESLAKRAITMMRPRPSSIALRCLGVYARRLQAADSARKYLTAAKVAAETEGDRAELVRVLRELAVTEALDARSNVALEIISRARLICDALGSGSISASLHCAHGAVLMQSQEFDAAERYLLESAKAATESGSKLWLAWAEHQRAMLLLREGKLSHARDLSFRAMDGFTEMRHRYGLARCRFLTGLALQREERWLEAAIEIEEAMGTFFTCNDKWIEAQAMEVLADILRRGYPGRKNEASELKASAAHLLKRIAIDRRDTAAYAEREGADEDTEGTAIGRVQRGRREFQ